MKHFLGLVVVITALAVHSFAFAQALVFINPPELDSPAVDEQFTVKVKIKDGTDVLGYQLAVAFDPTALSFINIKNADYLPPGAFEVQPKPGTNPFIFGATSLVGASNGDGTLAEMTFKVVEVKASTIGLDDVLLSDPVGNPLDVTTEDGKIIVGADNELPVAVINAPDKARAGEEITLSGANSTDDGAITKYEWNFGDGNIGEGETVKHTYAQAGEFTVTLTVTDDGQPEALTGESTHIIIADAPISPVVTAHEPGAKVLHLKADIQNADTRAHCFIPVWEGELTVESGTFLEYQVRFAGTSVHKLGGVFLHTDSGEVLGPGEASNDPGWTHRRVALDDFAGKKVVAISVGTDNGENPTNPAGPFSMAVDNVQITNGTGILTAVWVGEDSIGGEQRVTEALEPPVEVSNCELSVQDEEVSVHPKGKSMTTWGKLKAAK
jgi:hypothetical protein